MVDPMTIRVLNAWCGRRDMSWSAAYPAGGRCVMTLRPLQAGRPWHRRTLVLDGPDMQLENERGETLASASDLPALLDAVDGGVGETLLDCGLAGLYGGRAVRLTALAV